MKIIIHHFHAKTNGTPTAIGYFIDTFVCTLGPKKSVCRDIKRLALLLSLSPFIFLSFGSCLLIVASSLSLSTYDQVSNLLSSRLRALVAGDALTVANFKLGCRSFLYTTLESEVVAIGTVFALVCVCFPLCWTTQEWSAIVLCHGYLNSATQGLSSDWFCNCY